MALPDDNFAALTPPKPKIGAVVPCGHVFHSSCWNRWQSAHKRRCNSDERSANEKCKCPMCNAPCDSFVQLFLGEPASRKSSSNSNVGTSSFVEEDSESIVLLAKTCHDSARRLDRVKDKLNRYKRENKSLEIKLKEERRHMEQGMERMVERHSKERRSWKRQHVRVQEELKAEKETQAALQREMDQLKQEQEKERRKWKKHYKRIEQKLVDELNASLTQQAEQFTEWGQERATMQREVQQTQGENEAMKEEIDRTIVLQVEERRCKELQMKQLQEELGRAREGKAKAESKVEKAIQGIAQMRAYHEIKNDHVQLLVAEKIALEEELRMVKEVAEAHEEVLFD